MSGRYGGETIDEKIAGVKVFDFSNLGIDADDVQIVETSTIEADRGNRGLGGLVFCLSQNTSDQAGAQP